MKRNAVNPEREIRDLVRRAKSTPDRSGSLKYEAFQRLIGVIHTDDTSLKIFAAENVRFFLPDVPDLDETAIDAIYDLCEDPSSKVRVEGYLTITAVSKVQRKWIKRNTDVLVQLLQSEEPDELAIVKKALTEHLDLDPETTLGVLCDQIIPRQDTTDEEEIAIRERLRPLVFAYMSGEAKQAICERHALPGQKEEIVLYEGLFAAIPKLSGEDVQTIIKDLIYSLPAFKARSLSQRGSELLRLLLSTTVDTAVKTDLQSSSKDISLTLSRPLLEICGHITCDLEVAPAVELLQFYCASLIGRMTLQKMKPAEQQWVVANLATTLTTAEKQDANSHLPSLRRTIVDVLAYLLEVLKKSKLTEPRLAAAFGVFLRACLQRTKESWTPPLHLLRIVDEIQKMPGVPQSKEYEDLTMLLTQDKPEPASRKPSDSSPVPFASSTLPRAPISPPLRSTSQQTVNPRRPSAGLIIKPNNQSTFTTTQNSAAVKRNVTSEVTARPPKRPKVLEASTPRTAPSLLDRLGTSMDLGALPSRQASPSNPVSRVNTGSSISEHNPLPRTSHGLSIKGAAAKQSKKKGNSLSRTTSSSSLLDRLQTASSTTNGNQVRDQDAWKRRKNN